MISSVIPSLKYSSLGSPLIFTKGSTAMEGLSGSGKAILSFEATSILGVVEDFSGATSTGGLKTRVYNCHAALSAIKIVASALRAVGILTQYFKPALFHLS